MKKLLIACRVFLALLFVWFLLDGLLSLGIVNEDDKVFGWFFGEGE